MRKLLLLVFAAVLLSGCTVPENHDQWFSPEREAAISSGAVKVFTEADAYPPILHSDKWEVPVPVPGRVNTAGAEDSPFITPDGNTLYFFFTPDASIPPEKQLLDKVTGIWYSSREAGMWNEPQRMVLQDTGKLSLDGCLFVQGNNALFCSAREGYTGIHWFSAEYLNGKWTGWRNSDFDPDYQVGELHIYGDELYFHSGRPGGKGGLDLWVSRKVNGEWQQPENIQAVNTPDNEGWPFVSQDGNELWFLRTYQGSPAIFLSKKSGGLWQAPALIISQFAGEPTLDSRDNLYFVHHFYRDGKMLEADIYVAYKKRV